MVGGRKPLFRVVIYCVCSGTGLEIVLVARLRTFGLRMKDKCARILRLPSAKVRPRWMLGEDGAFCLPK